MKDKWKYQRIERDCSSLPIAVAIYALDHISSRPAAAEPDLAGPRRETARGVPNAEAGARRRTLRAHEEKLHGEYRTQRLVLDAGPCGPTKRNCTGSTERRGWCSTPTIAWLPPLAAPVRRGSRLPQQAQAHVIETDFSSSLRLDNNRRMLGESVTGAVNITSIMESLRESLRSRDAPPSTSSSTCASPTYAGSAIPPVTTSCCSPRPTVSAACRSGSAAMRLASSPCACLAPTWRDP